MIYISKGISKSSLRKPLKVTRCGKTVQLSASRPSCGTREGMRLRPLKTRQRSWP